jgi:RimJ/RimL family protein N-acetyltransferase/catechol 2,3-dioxygenase-like lactoylglutathione lyase family enzyme
MPEPIGPTDLLAGERVRLRELREEDLSQLVRWWHDEDLAVRQVTGPIHPRPSAAVADMFRSWSQNTDSTVGLSAVTRDTEELVGHVTLYGADVKDRCATLAIIIGPPFQRRGLGRDALQTLIRYGFTELGLHRIELGVNGYNTAAIAAYTAVGFVEEGRRRQALFRHGTWHDHVQMGILADQWSAGSPAQTAAEPRLRIEVFAECLDAFVEFYTNILGFDLATDQRDAASPYAAVTHGTIQIGAARPWMTVDPAARTVPTGVEIVLELDNFDATYQRVKESGWPVADDRRERPWGLTDFRLHDPDGHYLRITTR